MRGRICGTGSYLPEKYYDNNDIAKIVETSDAWIREHGRDCPETHCIRIRDHGEYGGGGRETGP